MSDLTRAFLAVIVSTGVILLLALLTAVRKFTRDRREVRMRTRRSRYGQYLQDSDNSRSDPLVEAAGSIGAQWALIAVLTTQDVDPAVLREDPGYPQLKSTLIRQVQARVPPRRGAAILLLGILRDDDCVRTIAPALQDRDADVRLVAARALGLVGTDEAGEALLNGLRSNDLPEERIIERLAHPWALHVLREAIATPDEGAERQHFRACLARALGLIGDPAAEPGLLGLLAEGSDEERINAARALGQCGTDRCLGALHAALSDSDVHVRGQAAAALGELRDRTAIPLLEAAMRDPGWWVRSNAASALAKMGDEGTGALERVSSGDDGFAAQRAVEQLLLMGRN